MSSKKFRAALWLLVCLCLLVPLGCASGNKHAAAGDRLVLAIGGEHDEGFDPLLGWGASHYGSLLFYSSLLRRDHELKLEPDLAASYAISDEGRTWTFKLREAAVFADGQPVTAEDVVFTYEQIAKNGTMHDMTLLEKIEAEDASTVVMTLSRPQSTFMNTVVQTGIVPKHAYKEGFARQPMGSGPFQFVQWDEGQQLIVKPNPHYYGMKSEFEQITFLYLQEDAALAAAKAGQVDAAVVSPMLAGQAVKGMTLVQLDTVDNRGISFPYVKAGGTTAEGYPIGNDVTSDWAIRQAVNAAIDRQALIDGILEGYGSPAYTVNDHLPWWNEETVQADGDLALAEQILADAGWSRATANDVLEKDGLKASFPLIYPANDRTRQSLAIAVADRMKPLGIEIEVQGKSWDELEKWMYSSAVMMAWGNHNPLEMYYIYSSKMQGVDFYNIGFYSNAKVDEYLDLALTAMNEEEANAYWKLAQWDGTTGWSALGDAPWVWLVNVQHLYLVNNNLDIGRQKVHPHGTGWPITDRLEEWKRKSE